MAALPTRVTVIGSTAALYGCPLVSAKTNLQALGSDRLSSAHVDGHSRINVWLECPVAFTYQNRNVTVAM